MWRTSYDLVSWLRRTSYREGGVLTTEDQSGCRIIQSSNVVRSVTLHTRNEEGFPLQELMFVTTHAIIEFSIKHLDS